MNDTIKAILASVVAALIIGSGSAYFATVTTLATTQTEIKYIKSDIVSVRSLLATVNANQLEIVRRGEWMKSTESRLEHMERTQELIIEQTKDRYTRREAEKDYQRLYEKLQVINNIATN